VKHLDRCRAIQKRNKVALHSCVRVRGFANNPRLRSHLDLRSSLNSGLVERHHQDKASWLLLRITKTSTPVAAAPTSEPPNALILPHVLPSSAVPTDQSPGLCPSTGYGSLAMKRGRIAGYRDGGKCNRIVHDAALEWVCCKRSVDTSAAVEFGVPVRIAPAQVSSQNFAC